MEAKGCAKPAVWKDARRLFYWAFRSRIARSTALGALAKASPGASFEYRLKLVNSLASIEPGADDREVAEKLEALDISQNVRQHEADYLLHNLIRLTQDDKNAALNALTRLTESLSEDERLSLINALYNAPRNTRPLGKTYRLSSHRIILHQF